MVVLVFADSTFLWNVTTCAFGLYNQENLNLNIWQPFAFGDPPKGRDFYFENRYTIPINKREPYVQKCEVWW